jgi:hypothetical protein
MDLINVTFSESEEIIDQDFTAKTAPNVGMELQLSKNQSFTFYRTRERQKQQLRMHANHHLNCLNLALFTRDDPTYIE